MLAIPSRIAINSKVRRTRKAKANPNTREKGKTAKAITRTKAGSHLGQRIEAAIGIGVTNPTATARTSPETRHKSVREVATSGIKSEKRGTGFLILAKRVRGNALSRKSVVSGK